MKVMMWSVPDHPGRTVMKVITCSDPDCPGGAVDEGEDGGSRMGLVKVSSVAND